ncbi:MAG: TIGR03915 family putative DNA repair protein [Bacillota bacterium]|nr:TIGR03915 family putative DNA repair protein [Bacillota bacterium]
MDTAYIYDGTFGGLMTCIFEMYSRHEEPVSIDTEDYFQQRMGTSVYNVITDTEKSERVIKSALNKIGQDGFFEVYRAFLSDVCGREMIISGYLKLVFKIGSAAKAYLSNDYVCNMYKLSQKTGSEAHLLTGFLRFEEMEDGVLYAEMSPKSDCIEIVGGHFKSRLSALPFVINDRVRKKAFVYDTKNFDIAEYESFNAPNQTEKETDFQNMWRDFYKTVSIKARKNDRCRMTHMPKRYWKHMCELKDEK